MKGPIDYIIVGFEGNTFDGSILAALADAVDKNIIRVLALALISKDPDGNVSLLDINEVDDQIVIEFAKTYVSDRDLITDEDITEMSDLLENNTSAGMLVIEQVWALPLKQALINANGVLVAEGRIHPDAANELEN